MSERDTQFRGFARLLIPEIDEQFRAVVAWAEKHDIDDKAKIGEELTSRWQNVIARRAHDLVEHTLNACDLLEAEAGLEAHGFTSDYLLSHIPDVAEWPEETK